MAGHHRGDRDRPAPAARQRRTGVKVGVAAVLALVVLGSCASTKLAGRPIEGEPLRLVIRIAPDARIQARYSVTIDPKDPLRTIVSIGSAAAKASQVELAQARMDVAMQQLDMAAILEDELGGFFSDVLEMPIVTATRDATYLMRVEVERYGIDASGSTVRFVLSGRVELLDRTGSERIWRDRFTSQTQIGPAVFGLPPAAGNVLSAAVLSELTEEQIAVGIERVTRNAAWDVGSGFQDDLYRARRRRR